MRTHGIADYRIVESLGATEGAPAAGTAELIVDITTTGNTLTANALKVIEDGVMLRSQANLVAARGADWKNGALDTARQILDRIAGQDAGAVVSRDAHPLQGLRRRVCLRMARETFGIVTPFGGPTSSGMLTLHCPPDQVFALADFLRDKGAAGDLGVGDRLCVHAGQSAVREAEGGRVTGSGERVLDTATKQRQTPSAPAVTCVLAALHDGAEEFADAGCQRHRERAPERHADRRAQDVGAACPGADRTEKRKKA